MWQRSEEEREWSEVTTKKTKKPAKKTTYRSSSAPTPSKKPIYVHKEGRERKSYDSDPTKVVRSYICNLSKNISAFEEIMANPSEFIRINSNKVNEDTARAILLERAIMREPASIEWTNRIISFYDQHPVAQECFKGCIFHPIDSANWNKTMTKENYEKVVKFFFERGFSATSNNKMNESRIESILTACKEGKIDAESKYFKLEVIAKCITEDHISRMVPFLINKLTDKSSVALITELLFCYMKFPELTIKKFAENFLIRKTTTNIDSDTKGFIFISTIYKMQQMLSGYLDYDNPAYVQYITAHLASNQGNPIHEFGRALTTAFRHLQQVSSPESYISYETLLYAQACGILTNFGYAEAFDEVLNDVSTLQSPYLDQVDIARPCKLMCTMITQVPNTIEYYNVCKPFMEQYVNTGSLLDKFMIEKLYAKFKVQKPVKKVVKSEYGDEVIAAFEESSDLVTLRDELFDEVVEREDKDTVIEYLLQYYGPKQNDIHAFANSLI